MLLLLLLNLHLFHQHRYNKLNLHNTTITFNQVASSTKSTFLYHYLWAISQDYGACILCDLSFILYCRRIAFSRWGFFREGAARGFSPSSVIRLVGVVIHKVDIGATVGCKSSGSQRRGETTSLTKSFAPLTERKRGGGEIRRGAVVESMNDSIKTPQARLTFSFSSSVRYFVLNPERR